MEKMHKKYVACDILKYVDTFNTRPILVKNAIDKYIDYNKRLRIKVIC